MSQASGSKPHPVIYIKWGRGGKVGQGGYGGGHACGPSAESSPTASTCDNDITSVSSGQTTSEEED
jgi:hypothetical protein